MYLFLQQLCEAEALFPKKASSMKYFSKTTVFHCCRLHKVKICVSLQSKGFAIMELSSRLMPLALNYAVSWEVIQQTIVFLAIQILTPSKLLNNAPFLCRLLAFYDITPLSKSTVTVCSRVLISSQFQIKSIKIYSWGKHISAVAKAVCIMVG